MLCEDVPEFSGVSSPRSVFSAVFRQPCARSTGRQHKTKRHLGFSVHQIMKRTQKHLHEHRPVDWSDAIPLRNVGHRLHGFKVILPETEVNNAST